MIKLQGKSFMIHHDEKLSVVRDGDTVWTDGKPLKYNDITFDIICCVQPVDDKALLLVPEGDRHKKQFYVWTDNPSNEKSTLKLNDRIKRGDSVFQVQGVGSWGSYCRARMVKIDVQPEEIKQGT